MWALLPPWGSYSRAAAIHDYLCYLIAIGKPHPLAPTYQVAAAIFDEAMKVCGTSLIKRRLIITGVRFWFDIPRRFGRATPIPTLAARSSPDRSSSTHRAPEARRLTPRTDVVRAASCAPNSPRPNLKRFSMAN